MWLKMNIYVILSHNHFGQNSMENIPMDAKKYWNQFYEKSVFKSGKEPNNFVVSMCEKLSKGKVLDVGMGEGNNSVYLAQKGFEVEGFDVSEIAVARARALATETGVKISADTADADLYILKVLQYDSIIMTNFKPQTDRFFPEMVKALKQGGTILIDVLHEHEQDEAIAKDEYYKNHFYKSNEILNHIRDMRVLFYQETKINGKIRIQAFAKKHLDKDAVKYDLFGMATKNAENKNSKQLDLAESLFKT